MLDNTTKMRPLSANYCTSCATSSGIFDVIVGNRGYTDCHHVTFHCLLYQLLNKTPPRHIHCSVPLSVSAVMGPAYTAVDCVWNVMAHAQKPDFVFGRNGRVHLNRRGRQFSWLLAVEVCAWAVVMLHTPCSEVVWGVLATHSIRQFPLHFPSRASPCAITFHLDSTTASFPEGLYTVTNNITINDLITDVCM